MDGPLYRARRGCFGVGRVGHQRGQVAGPVAELLIESDVLGTLREGEQRGALEALFVEDLYGCIDQQLRNAAVPILRQNRERAEERARSPAGEQVGADEAAVGVRWQRLPGGGRPAGD